MRIDDLMASEPSLNGAGDEGNTLVLAPAIGEGSDEACGLLFDVANPASANVLFVTLTGTADECVDRWYEDIAASTPANLGIVCVDESTRSASMAAGSGAQASLGGHVRTVGSPGDLTGIGVSISEFLSEWAGAGETVACFDSITPLLQYTDTRRVFQFFHVLTRRMEEAGARAHYHMDPAAHDEQTVQTFVSLFDEVVDFRDESEGPAAETTSVEGP